LIHTGRITDLAGAAVIAERLRTRVRQHPFCHEGKDYRVPLSLGVTASGAGPLSPQEMIRRADERLYPRPRTRTATRWPPDARPPRHWFEKARRQIEEGKCRRAGLLATQGIRGGANRDVLRHIKETGDIFFAESDRDWVLDGANVHISMVGFDGDQEKERLLDGKPVAQINADLSAADADLTTAARLRENLGLAFMGDTKGGPFDISWGSGP
jgi:hypothetical protein